MSTYEICNYPKSRIGTFDVGWIGKKKHHIIGLFEIDVTIPRQSIKEQIKKGRRIGFTSWIIKIISQTISENRNIHAINYKRYTQIIFDDVDIAIPIEREVEGKEVPLVSVIRKTNEKTIEQIFDEIEGLKKQRIQSAGDNILKGKKIARLADLFFSLPTVLRHVFWKALLSNPFKRKETMGTVMVTNVGGIGSFPGWIIPKSMHNLCLGIGSICKKPWIVDGDIVKRDILNMTILIDHDVVDGVPAAKFTERLARNIERGILL